MDSIFYDILKDSFFSNFSFTSDYVYPLVLMYGKSNSLVATVFAFIGSVAGLMTLFYFFTIIGSIKFVKKLLEGNPGFPAAKHYINKFSPVFGIFIAIPQLSIVPSFFCGLTRLKPVKFLIITIFYRAIFYTYELTHIHHLVN